MKADTFSLALSQSNHPRLVDFCLVWCFVWKIWIGLKQNTVVVDFIGAGWPCEDYLLDVLQKRSCSRIRTLWGHLPWQSAIRRQRQQDSHYIHFLLQGFSSESHTVRPSPTSLPSSPPLGAYFGRCFFFPQPPPLCSHLRNQVAAGRLNSRPVTLLRSSARFETVKWILLHCTCDLYNYNKIWLVLSRITERIKLISHGATVLINRVNLKSVEWRWGGTQLSFCFFLLAKGSLRGETPSCQRSSTCCSTISHPCRPMPPLICSTCVLETTGSKLRWVSRGRFHIQISHGIGSHLAALFVACINTKLKNIKVVAFFSVSNPQWEKKWRSKI